MATWDFNDKQANFSDVLDLAHTSGPQRIKRGDQRLFVVAEDEWLALKERASEALIPIRKIG